ncbi:MAG: acetyl-CoA carboxylase biotin carboxyl carrier protein [Deltaproteobacteria bacterium]|nr:acetyl-CoA carboxylase biotin carboxyl carrier protein [Deltaproteobacteria bacterium]
MSKTRDSNLPDLEYVRELAKVFKRYELDEMEIETGEQRVLLRRGDAAPTVVAAPAPVAVAAPAPVAAAPAPAPSGVVPAPEPVMEGDFITSPFVGTFYRAPRPDAPPFMELGARVEEGSTVCVVEAMKLFNEIEAEFACVVEEVLVENAQAVEFGTKLFRVRKL